MEEEVEEWMGGRGNGGMDGWKRRWRNGWVEKEVEEWLGGKLA